MKAKKFVKIEPFLNCEEPEIAYIFGFLWGDGYIQNLHGYNVRTKIEKSDGEELLKIFSKFGDWNVNFYQPKGINDKEQMIIHTNNKDLFNLFVSLDFEDKMLKSPQKLLNFIPKNLHKYFFRGLSDADGCIYFSSKNPSDSYFSISSNYDQDWSFIMDYFNFGKVVKQRNHLGGTSRFVVKNKKYLLKILNFIYSDKLFGLNRKYNKYLEIFNKYSFKYNTLNNYLIINEF